MEKRLKNIIIIAKQHMVSLELPSEYMQPSVAALRQQIKDYKDSDRIISKRSNGMKKFDENGLVITIYEPSTNDVHDNRGTGN